MKKFFILLAFVAATLAAHADEFPYLAIERTDGSVTVMTAANLTLTYAEGTLTVANGETNETFETASLSRMYFTDTATGIAEIAAAGRAVPVDVWAADGRSLGRFPSLQDATKRLNKGTYVIKANDTTFKVAVQ